MTTKNPTLKASPELGDRVRFHFRGSVMNGYVVDRNYDVENKADDTAVIAVVGIPQLFNVSCALVSVILPGVWIPEEHPVAIPPEPPRIITLE